MAKMLYYMKIYYTASLDDTAQKDCLLELGRLLHQAGGNMFAFCFLPVQHHFLFDIPLEELRTFTENMRRFYQSHWKNFNYPSIQIVNTLVEKIIMRYEYPVLYTHCRF